MELDPSSTEHSPPYSENNRSWSWNQVTDEVSSFTDSNNELCGLMEDKEVAARAVAFVVNSTRKGIVPLCADVAHLMRSKQCLERKIRILKRENDAYRSSLNGGSMPSHSMSPTPPSLSSYTEQCIKSLQEQSIAKNEQFRSSSRCSNSSSTYSYSPQLDKNRLAMYNYSPKLDKSQGALLRQSGVHYSPSDTRKFPHTSTTPSAFKRRYHPIAPSSLFHPDGQERSLDIKAPSIEGESTNRETFNDDVIYDDDIATCIVGDLSSDIFSNIEKLNLSEKYENDEISTDDKETKASEVTLRIEDETGTKTNQQTCDNDDFCVLPNNTNDKLRTAKTLLERRRVSLPEITTKPNSKAIKVRPKQSKEVQCSLDKPERSKDQALEEQFMRSVKLNAKLEEDLNEARKEIEKLRKRLKRLESYGAIPKSFPEELEVVCAIEDKGYYTGSNRTSRTGSEHERVTVLKKPSEKHPSSTSVTYGGSIPLCKCSSCRDAFGSEDDLSHYSDSFLDEPQTYPVNSKLLVQMDDHVTTRNGLSGFIRYLGHLDSDDQSSTVFVGLELASADGTCDGSHNGKQYFCCKKNHGIFVPVTDVVSKMNKKGSTKSFREDAVRGKKSSKRSKDDKITSL